MKSKSYVLMQIKELLIHRHDYTETKSSAYIEDIQEKTVYELLTLKKQLSESEEVYPDVSISYAIRNRFSDEDD